MELATAIALIRKGVTPKPDTQVWADLGCGKGLFTAALAALLSKDSTIYAVDRDGAALKAVGTPAAGVILKKMVHDFIRDGITLEPCDGILMANSFHFAADKYSLLQSLKTNLKSSGRILLVEYDTDQSNPWVPYPISFSSLQALAAELKFETVIKLDETRSVYNQANIYSAVLY